MLRKNEINAKAKHKASINENPLTFCIDSSFVVQFNKYCFEQMAVLLFTMKTVESLSSTSACDPL